MDSIRIIGNHSLYGEVGIQGSKNAALPILAASVLIEGEVVLHNCPRIRDTTLMIQLLEQLGAKILIDGHTLRIINSSPSEYKLSKDDVQGMRSSIVLLGAMLGRFKKAVIYSPGGCVIGNRPIDLHLMALEQLGAGITIEDDCITAEAKNLAGATIQFPMSSVGATENAILAAVTAKGTTVLHNASREPEVEALCEFLRCAGAVIHGIGTTTLTIIGSTLHSVEYQVPSDRIVTGTYLLAAAGTGGEIVLNHAPVQEMSALIHVLSVMGCQVRVECDRIILLAKQQCLGIDEITTQAYPGFPTDLQPQLASVLTTARKKSSICETIFEKRFAYLSELVKMGANILQEDHRILITPVEQLHGTTVQTTDLRAGAALVIAGLMAQGVTIVEQAFYIERGYENLTADLCKLGAKIE